MSDLGSLAALIADIEAKVTTNGANENTGARVQQSLKNIADTLNGLIKDPAGLPYRFSTTTNPSGIGTSYVRVNNATVGAVTELYIHQEDMSITDRAAVLATLSAGGLVYLNSRVDGNTVGVFKATSCVDSGTYFTITGTLNGTLPNDNDEIRVTVAPAEVTGVKRYVARLFQEDTNAPVANVLENTLGGTVVWTYDSVGNYIATLAGAFTANKTHVLLNMSLEVVAGEFISGVGVAAPDSIGLTIRDATNTAIDGFIGFIEIKVYP
jgi:hypothetical protein